MENLSQNTLTLDKNVYRLETTLCTLNIEMAKNVEIDLKSGVNIVKSVYRYQNGIRGREGG